MVRIAAALALGSWLLTACHVRNPAFCPDGEDPGGACVVSPDAAPRACLGAPPFALCVTPPEAPRTLGDLHTGDGCDEVVTAGRELCVVKGTDLEVAQRISITGPRPLVLLASGTLTVTAEGFVDAAGTEDAVGPGADLACAAGATAGEDNLNGGGGGAGGSFGSRGGDGGDGDSGTGTKGTAGLAFPILPALQGGCSGTGGGHGSPVGTGGGAGGRGGGGIYLVAGRTLAIHGTLTASGAGGRPGQPSKGGGGGGGSGGMIVLHAPTLELSASARIFANGGGGASGAKGGGDGSPGETPNEPYIGAAGGVGQGGSGGAGAYLTTAAGAGASSPDGGGGGGGGAGVIVILGGGAGAASVSPPPAPLPPASGG